MSFKRIHILIGILKSQNKQLKTKLARAANQYIVITW